jgi:hypothetical protein
MKELAGKVMFFKSLDPGFHSNFSVINQTDKHKMGNPYKQWHEITTGHSI